MFSFIASLFYINASMAVGQIVSSMKPWHQEGRKWWKILDKIQPHVSLSVSWLQASVTVLQVRSYGTCVCISKYKYVREESVFIGSSPSTHGYRTSGVYIPNTT